MTVGSSRPLEDAWRIGQSELVHWFGELYGLPHGRLPTALPDHRPLANVVDANYSAVVKARKAMRGAVEG